MMSLRKWGFSSVVALLTLFAWNAFARHADVTFFVIGKHASYRQDDRGEPSAVDHSFFSEIFLTPGGDASNGWLTLPTGERFAFSDQRQAEGGERDNLLLVSGRARYAQFEELQADYPDGAYRIDFDTPGGAIRDARLRFAAGGLPRAPRILLTQGGAPVCTTVDPERDLEVRWTPFEQGGADPNGILDDLIFVILRDAEGQKVAHSGRPFGAGPYLTYRDEGYMVPAGRMTAGVDYRLSVEHAILDDTGRYAGIPAMTTRAVTTRMDIRAEATTPGIQGDCRSVK